MRTLHQTLNPCELFVKCAACAVFVELVQRLLVQFIWKWINWKSPHCKLKPRRFYFLSPGFKPCWWGTLAPWFWLCLRRGFLLPSTWSLHLKPHCGKLSLKRMLMNIPAPGSQFWTLPSWRPAIACSQQPAVLQPGGGILPSFQVKMWPSVVFFHVRVEIRDQMSILNLGQTPSPPFWKLWEHPLFLYSFW